LRFFLITAAVITLAALPVWAQDDALPTDDEALIARERIRSEVEGIIAELNAPAGVDAAELFHGSSERLAALGPPVVPYMAAEIDRPTAFTYNVAAYVLGLVGTPEARAALEKAVARADQRDAGNFSLAQKVWALLGLAMAGGPRSLELMAEGAWTGPREMLSRTTLVELAALLTAPESVPILVGWLTRFDTDETVQPRLIYTIRALGRIGDPSTRDAIRPFLKHERWHLRKEAALALAKIGDVSDGEAIAALLNDDTREVREAAAEALELLQPPGMTRPILARLDVEDYTPVRVKLYAALAATGDPDLLTALTGHWGRDDYLDRARLVTAVATLGNPKGLNLLRVGLRDPVGNVSGAAVRGLAANDSPAARDTLLAQLLSPQWHVASGAAEALTALGESRAAPRIADRLLRGELGEPVTDPRRRSSIRLLGDCLVTLRYTEPKADLEKAARSQPDPEIVEYLEELVMRLDALETLGDDVAKWTALLESDNAAMRLLAIDKLSELGGKPAVRSLVGFFEGADKVEQIATLKALGRIGSLDAMPLLATLLLDETYDAHDVRQLRDTAAWAARRIGGQESIDLLRRSVKRREGRDVNVLVYLAVLDGPGALAELEAYRVSRFRDLDWFRGEEQERIDWMRRELSAGRSISSLDLPPEEINLGPWW
jgi:HEAT repeat protein